MNRLSSVILTIGLISLLGFLPSCWEQEKAPEKLSGVVLVNVLDEKLYNDCHIKGSINIPFESIEQCEQKIDKDAEVVLHCSNYMCAASGHAGKKLCELGFKKVCVYEGGVAEWYQKGLPVEGPSKSSYLSNYVDIIIENDQDPELSRLSTDELALKMGFDFSKK